MCIRDRINVRLEMRELLAVFGRKNLGARRKRLADLDEAWAELLEHGTQRDGGYALEGMIAAHDAQELAQAREAGTARQPELLLRTDARWRVEDALEQVVTARRHESLFVLEVVTRVEVVASVGAVGVDDDIAGIGRAGRGLRVGLDVEMVDGIDVVADVDAVCADDDIIIGYFLCLDDDVIVSVLLLSLIHIFAGGNIGTHLQMGIGDGVIPAILDRSVIDATCVVSDDEAITMAQRLAREEGLLCGISSGTNVVAAMMLGYELGPDATVVTVLTDTGERYFSTPLFGE